MKKGHGKQLIGRGSVGDVERIDLDFKVANPIDTAHLKLSTVHLERDTYTPRVIILSL